MSDYGERLKALRKAKYPDFSEDMDMHDITDGMSWMADRIEELEDKLEKAVEALERLSTAELHGDGEAWGHRLSESAMGREILARMKFAHTTLAELTSSEAANGEAKGGKDEC